jgi:hypothetical protein
VPIAPAPYYLPTIRRRRPTIPPPFRRHSSSRGASPQIVAVTPVSVRTGRVC